MKKLDARSIALKRCEKLLGLAKSIFSEDKDLALRYVDLAKKISMRHRVKLGSKEFCKKCCYPFIAGKTLKTRLESKTGFVTLECLNCGAKRRIARYK